MDIVLFSHSVLIYYAVNALIALALIRPGSPAFEKILRGPIDRVGADRVLIVLLHVALPLLLMALLRPRSILHFVLAILSLPLRLYFKIRLTMELRKLPQAQQDMIRAHLKAGGKVAIQRRKKTCKNG